jgi:predicted nucleotidyltransferase
MATTMERNYVEAIELTSDSDDGFICKTRNKSYANVAKMISKSTQCVSDIDDEYEEVEEYSTMINIFIKLIFMIFKNSIRYDSVYIFGSIARMIATSQTTYHKKSDIDIFVACSVDLFIEEIKERIEIMNLMNHKTSVFTKFVVEKEKKNESRYSTDILGNFKYKLHYIDSKGRKGIIPVDFATGTITKPICSWEIFKYNLDGCTLRYIKGKNYNYMDAINDIKHNKCIVFPPTREKREGGDTYIKKRIERYIKLIDKYPFVNFLPNWEDEDDISEKTIIPIKRSSYKEKYGEYAECCICQKKQDEYDDDSEIHPNLILVTACNHTMCFNCTLEHVKIFSYSKKHRCPMCREFLH